MPVSRHNSSPDYHSHLHTPSCREKLSYFPKSKLATACRVASFIFVVPLINFLIDAVGVWKHNRTVEQWNKTHPEASKSQEVVSQIMPKPAGGVVANPRQQAGQLLQQGLQTLPSQDRQNIEATMGNPMEFYRAIDDCVEKGVITKENAIPLLYNYDVMRACNMWVSDAIAWTDKITPNEKYDAYQTFRIVRNDVGAYTKALSFVVDDKYKAANLTRYQEAWWKSTHDFKEYTQASIEMATPINETNRALMQCGLNKNLPDAVVIPQIGSLADDPPSPGHKTQVYVHKEGTSQVTRKLCEKGLRTAMDDMANPYVAGGGIKHGNGAQEEQECMNGNLGPVLESQRYPIPEFGVIVAPQVTFFKDRDESIPPFKADVIAGAAYCCEATSGKVDKPAEHYEEKTKEKIRAKFRTAIRNGNNAFVLGALGCGAFGNDPRVIANLYAQILREESEFAGRFEEIHFAVVNDRRGPENFEIFRDCLTNLLKNNP